MSGEAGKNPRPRAYSIEEWERGCALIRANREKKRKKEGRDVRRIQGERDNSG